MIITSCLHNKIYLFEIWFNAATRVFIKFRFRAKVNNEFFAFVANVIEIVPISRNNFRGDCSPIKKHIIDAKIGNREAAANYFFFYDILKKRT